jgi:hypothetical protein
MSCNNAICRLNDELLALLPTLEANQQQLILRRWRDLDLGGRDALVRSLREPRPAEVDLATLSKLAQYFQCGVYDVMRYTSGERT